jgi:hypothetical protein
MDVIEHKENKASYSFVMPAIEKREYFRIVLLVNVTAKSAYEALTLQFWNNQSKLSEELSKILHLTSCSSN